MYKRLLITLAIGDVFQKMGMITHPLMKSYAKKCGAEFHCINEKRLHSILGLPTYEKFQLYDFLDGKYDQVLFVDTDILISPNAPNVFEICPPNQFGAAGEEGYSMSIPHRKLTQEKLGKVNWCNPYFNSGMMLLSPIHREIFNPNSELLRNWTSDSDNNDHIMSDQPILNYLVNYYSFEMNDLGYKFNHTRVITDTKSRFNSHFIHYSGPSGHRYGPRMRQIELDSEVMSSPVNLLLSRKVTYYRWLADRVNFDFLKYLIKKFSAGTA